MSTITDDRKFLGNNIPSNLSGIKILQLIVREMHFCRSSGLEFHESKGTNWTNPKLGELCFTFRA